MVGLEKSLGPPVGGEAALHHSTIQRLVTPLVSLGLVLVQLTCFDTPAMCVCVWREWR